MATALKEQYCDYITERTTYEDDFLKNLKQEAKAAHIPEIQVGLGTASLMQILLKSNNAKRVVEIGTCFGYSALWMARALPDDGVVESIELDDKHADFAENWISQSDVAGKIKIRRGKGHEIITTYEDSSIDVCFVDADKESQPFYTDQAWRILKPGGLYMVDNALAFGHLFNDGDLSEEGKQEVQSIRDFNDQMASDQRWLSVIVPLGDGLWLGVKKP